MHDNCAVSHCGKPTDEILCGSCVDDLTSDLRAIIGDPSTPGLWADLEVTLTKQTNMGKPIRVATRSGSPTLFHEGASDARRQLEATVWYWVYLFADANQHLSFDPFQATVVEACSWLVSFPGLLAQLDTAGDMVGDFKAAVKNGLRIVDRQPARVYLGVCASKQEVGTCQFQLYADRGQATGDCPVCGTAWFADDRRRALIRRVFGDSVTATATDASRLLAQLGMEVGASTIRKAAMTRIVKGEVRGPRLKTAGEDKRGHATYLVEDILKLFVWAEKKAA